ncbi:MAG TPA: hypothetical protein VLA21_07865 [Candidatus Limnocylindria bacterium]|nr:hypothetical protein [Candidatus Limnocylindria bacterium]
MATCTAIGILGTSHPNDGGILVHHVMRLYENGCGRLVIERPSGLRQAGEMLGHWICTNRVLEDMMLMGAVYALEDGKTVAACRAAGCPETTLASPWELEGCADRLEGPRLLAKEAYAGRNMKLVLVSLTGSTMQHHLEAAKEYTKDVEICTPWFNRHEGGWSM